MTERRSQTTRYSHILAAVDLSPGGEVVAGRALEMAKDHGAACTLMHVVANLFEEPSYEFMTTLPVDVDLQEQVTENARESLRALASRIGHPEIPCRVASGTPKSAIVETVMDLRCDLIVLGNHGVHGWELLLGSTANAVLHAAPCDVLAIKIGGADAQ